MNSVSHWAGSSAHYNFLLTCLLSVRHPGCDCSHKALCCRLQCLDHAAPSPMALCTHDLSSPSLMGVTAPWRCPSSRMSPQSLSVTHSPHRKYMKKWGLVLEQPGFQSNPGFLFSFTLTTTLVRLPPSAGNNPLYLSHTFSIHLLNKKSLYNNPVSVWLS